jgi:hypothetical protein
LIGVVSVIEDTELGMEGPRKLLTGSTVPTVPLGWDPMPGGTDGAASKGVGVELERDRERQRIYLLVTENPTYTRKHH